MIEIHSHILPGLDDGAKTIVEALEMARIAVSQGIQDLIATPHHANGTYENPAQQVKQAVAAFNEVLRSEHIPLTVHSGQEIRVNQELIDDWERGNLCSLAGTRYILLELPARSVPIYLREVIHELVIRDLVPIIAHPERNLDIYSTPELLIPLINQGARCQLTAQSIIGLFGRKIQKLSITLCRSGMIHFVSSDAHNCYRRTFALQEAYRLINKQLKGNYEVTYSRNAKRLLEDKEILANQPILIKNSLSTFIFGG